LTVDIGVGNDVDAIEFVVGGRLNADSKSSIKKPLLIVVVIFTF